MVFVKRICPSKRRKAIIAVKAKPSSPDISMNSTQESESTQPFQLRISLHIAETTRPGEAITICTNKSVFAPSDPTGERDTLARGTIGLFSASDISRCINLGQFIIHTARAETPLSPDLKERASTHLLTIPASGDVEIAHDLPLDRMFRYSDRLRADDVVGGTWQLKLREGYIGTSWWCWGDLDAGLKNKRLSAWHAGMRSEIMRRPEIVGDDWVLGCNRVELVFEDRTEDSTFRFVRDGDV